MVVEAALRFVHRQARHSKPRMGGPASFPVKVPASLEGIDPCFRSNLLVAARVKGHNNNFNQIGVDPWKACDPVPNVMNTEFILFDDSDIGYRMVEAMTLSHDHHVICHSEETMEEFVEKLCESLRLVSHLSYHIHLPHFCLFFVTCFQQAVTLAHGIMMKAH